MSMWFPTSHSFDQQVLNTTKTLSIKCARYCSRCLEYSRGQDRKRSLPSVSLHSSWIVIQDCKHLWSRNYMLHSIQHVDYTIPMESVLKECCWDLLICDPLTLNSLLTVSHSKRVPYSILHVPTWIHVNSDIALLGWIPDFSVMANEWYRQQLPSPAATADIACGSQHFLQIKWKQSLPGTSLPSPLFSWHEANREDWPTQALLRRLDFFFFLMFSQAKRCDKKAVLIMRTECQPCSLNFGTKCPDGYTKITNGTVGVRDCRYSLW